MTVNDQLREAAEQVRRETRDLDLPLPPSGGQRRSWTPALALILTIGAISAMVWLAYDRADGPVATTPDAPGPSVTTVLPGSQALVEVWHYPSTGMANYQGPGNQDFLVYGDRVAVPQEENARSLSVLDLESGAVMWEMDFPEQPGTLLTATNDRLAWATHERVGVSAADGTTLWEHRFDDDRWPSRGVFDGDRLIVALDPVMEGDERPPLLIQFDDSGEVLWTTELSGANVDEDLQWTDLLLAEDGVLVQTTGALYRVDSLTGAQEWRFLFADAAVESFAHTGTMVWDGMVYAADPASEFSGRDGGEVIGLNAVTGEIHLAFPTARHPRIVGVLDRWLVHMDESGAHGQSLDSRDVWTHTDLGAMGTIDGANVFTVSPKAVARLGDNGELEHEVDTNGGTPQLPPVVLGGTLIAPGWEGTRAIDIATGEVVNQWPGDFYAKAMKVNASSAVVGVSGDGVYLVRLP